MSKPEFGTKYVCAACSERFYDLNRSPVICFRCGTEQALPKPRISRPIRAGSDRSVFSRRAPAHPIESKVEPEGDLVVDDADDTELPDDDEIDDDAEVEIEVEVDPDDGKIIA
jgi:uncharacterized protein (TIGR02300 family)